jgi:hypothetical protein
MPLAKNMYDAIRSLNAIPLHSVQTPTPTQCDTRMPIMLEAAFDLTNGTQESQLAQ